MTDKAPALAFVDSHVHLDHVLANHPDHIEWMRNVGCLPVSWCWAQAVDSVDGLQEYLESHLEALREVRQAGLPCFFLAGIHPRNIPDDLAPEMVYDLVMPYVEDPLCLGVGEIGLETGSDREKEIFRAVLEVGRDAAGMGKVVGVHTPRQDKERVLAEILPLVAEAEVPPEAVVVDHLTAPLVPKVLSAGYFAGVTLSPVKSTVKDLAALAGRYAGDEDALFRILANTDSGLEVYKDLYLFTRYTDVPEEVRQRMCRENALAFFHLSD